MSKTLIVFATKPEALATIQLLKAQPISNQTLFTEGQTESCYTFNQGWIVLCGLGIYAAQMCVAKYSDRVQEIWNLGLAGVLQKGFALGDILTIQTVGKYIPYEDSDTVSKNFTKATAPVIHLESGTHKLISSDFPVHNIHHHIQLATQWDLVDMEGYGIAYAASYLGKKCRIWKIISDWASPGGRDLITKHKAKYSERLAKTIYETLNESRFNP